MKVKKEPFVQVGPLIVFGVTGGLGRAFLDHAVHWLQKSREVQDANGNRHFVMPWRKIVVAISSESDDARTVEKIVREFASQEVDFIHYNSQSVKHVQMISSDCEQALIIPSASPERLRHCEV